MKIKVEIELPDELAEKYNLDERKIIEGARDGIKLRAIYYRRKALGITGRATREVIEETYKDLFHLTMTELLPGL